MKLHSRVIDVRGNRRLGWALLCACATLFAFAPSAGAATPVPAQSYGFSDPNWGSSYITHAQYLTSLTMSHAKYVRTPVNWQYYEPTEGTYSNYFLTYFWDEYTQLKANGQTPIFDIIGTPYWALTDAGKDTTMGDFACLDNAGATQCMAPPDVRDPDIAAHFKMFFATLAYIMPDAVFEVWNEPNISWFWMQPQDPALYGLMLKTASDGVRMGSPTAKVISGSVNGYAGPDNAANTSYTTFLKQMYPVAGKASFDGLGFHSYPCNQVATTAGWTKQPAADVAGIRAARNAAGDSTKPLWWTEMGAATSGPAPANCSTSFTEAQQGPALGAVLSWAKTQNASKGDLPVVLDYSLFDTKPRTKANVPNAQGEDEFGVASYTWNAASGTSTLQAKPGFTTVACKFAGTC